jgi:hypothetical protein
MAWVVCDHILVLIPLSPPPHQLSNDMSFIHQHITFTVSWSIRSMSSPVVCLSVCRRVVLAPLHLCSLLNMFAPSHSQALLYTEKIAVIEATSIGTIIHQYLYLYQYHHLSLFVLLSVHIYTNLLSVHVAPLSLSFSDILATAFQRLETYGYRDHTYTGIWRCIYRYTHIATTLTASLSSPRTLSLCFSLHRCSCSVCLLVIYMCRFLLFCLSHSLSILIVLHAAIVFNFINLLPSKLASVLSISTIHHFFLLTVLAPLLLSILDFIAALNKKESVDGGMPYIPCLHSFIPSSVTILATVFVDEKIGNKFM